MGKTRSPAEWGVLIGCLGILGAPIAWAEEGLATPVPVPAPTLTTKSPLIQKRGKRREQKETEGTEAPERFEADTILKSPYSVDGQPLEVDPD